MSEAKDKGKVPCTVTAVKGASRAIKKRKVLLRTEEWTMNLLEKTDLSSTMQLFSKRQHKHEI